MLKTARLRREFYPHKYSNSGVLFELKKVGFDNGDSFEQPDSQRRLIAIEDYKDWNTASLYGTVGIKDNVWDLVLPEHERGNPPVEICIALRCYETYLRESFKDIKITFPTDRLFEVKIPIEKSMLSNTAEVSANLLRTANGRSDIGDGYAALKGTAVAGCRSWEIRVDPPKLSSGNYLDIRYTRFEDEKKKRLYEVSSDSPSPILWLNKDNNQIANVLNSKAPRGITARMRDVFFDMISYSVWYQLMLQAAENIDENGELVYEWEYAVLEDFLPGLFPDIDLESARIEFAEAVRSDGICILMQQIDELLQDKIEYKKQMSKLIQEGLPK